MQSFLSPSGPPRLLLVLTHILDLFARPQAAPCLSRHPRLQPANLCPIPVLQGEEPRVGRERGLSTDEC